MAKEALTEEQKLVAEETKLRKLELAMKEKDLALKVEELAMREKAVKAENDKPKKIAKEDMAGPAIRGKKLKEYKSTLSKRYFIRLKVGKWQVGKRVYFGHESVKGDLAIHFIGCGLVLESDHPMFKDVYGTKKGRPVSDKAQDQKIVDAAYLEFDKGPWRFVKEYAEERGQDYNLLLEHGAEKWEEAKIIPLG